MKKIIILSSIFIIVLFSNIAFAHPGGTDGNGGHYNHATGEYHYHHGYSAHQHENGICPYDFEDQSFYDDLTTNYQPETNLPMGPEEPYIKNEKSLVQFGGISMETFIPILIAIVLFSFSLFFFIRSSRNQSNTNKKKRQKFYTDKETTPMAFHQFYAYTILPLSVLSCIRHFIMSALSADTGNIISIILYVILILLLSNTCYFLIKYKPLGWYLNNISIAFVLLMNIFTLVFFLYDLTEEMIGYVISTMFVCASLILIFIYYLKRKSLFIPSKERKIEETTIAPLNETIDISKNNIDVTPPQNKKTKKTTMLLLILLLISIGGNVFCAFRIAQLSEMYEESRKNAKAYYNSYLNQKFENDEIKNNGSYYNENAVIVDIDSWTYHRSNCPKTGCRIMDQGNAFALGFSPCDTCFNPNW